jgi:hypothetical protein
MRKASNSIGSVKLGAAVKHTGKNPVVWFGNNRPSLALVSSFINGFQLGREQSDDTFRFQDFTQWVASRYRVIDGPMNGFSLILEKVGGDERLAYDEFFTLLPEYLRDVEEIGEAGIGARYVKVMEAIRKTGGTGR